MSMSIVRSFVVAAALSSMLPGCYSAKMYSANATASRTERTAVVNSFLFGIVPVNDVNLDALCGEKGFAQVKTSINGWGLLASTVTMGLYTPITVRATCAE
ncbi:MAG: hypothetical protein KC621_24910 [Myxococcales bacterium]|nr:hypothetical protein [Myxococcales bacterium]